MGHFTVELRLPEAKSEACRPAPATAPGVFTMDVAKRPDISTSSISECLGWWSKHDQDLNHLNERTNSSWFCFLLSFWIFLDSLFSGSDPCLWPHWHQRCQTAFRMEALLGGELYRTYVKNKHILSGSKERMTLSKTVIACYSSYIYITYNLLVMTCIYIYIYPVTGTGVKVSFIIYNC